MRTKSKLNKINLTDSAAVYDISCVKCLEQSRLCSIEIDGSES